MLGILWDDTQTLQLIIWSVGVAGILASAWIQDRREIRRDDGNVKKLCESYEARIETLEGQVYKLTYPKGGDE